MAVCHVVSRFPCYTMQWINAAVLLAKVEMKRFCQPHRSRMLISYHPFPQPKTTWSLFSCARSLAQCINAAHAMRSWEQIPRRFCSRYKLQDSHGFTLCSMICVFLSLLRLVRHGDDWTKKYQQSSSLDIIAFLSVKLLCHAECNCSCTCIVAGGGCFKHLICLSLVPTVSYCFHDSNYWALCVSVSCS